MTNKSENRAISINWGVVLSTLLLSLYIGSVLFLCLHKFVGTNFNLSDYWHGIKKDKIAHFFLFFPFPFVYYIFLKFNGIIKIKRENTVTVIVITGLFMATVFEVFQELLTTTRHSDPADLCANLTAIIAASVIVWAISSPKNK